MGRDKGYEAFLLRGCRAPSHPAVTISAHHSCFGKQNLATCKWERLIGEELWVTEIFLNLSDWIWLWQTEKENYKPFSFLPFLQKYLGIVGAQLNFSQLCTVPISDTELYWHTLQNVIGYFYLKWPLIISLSLFVNKYSCHIN